MTPAEGRGRWLILARAWHGYLSAFAFLSVLFFAFTGILLNHPQITDSRLRPLVQRPFVLTPAEIASLQTDPNAARSLELMAIRRGRLKGTFIDGEKSGEDIVVRMEGASGSTFIRGDLSTGKVDVSIVPVGVLEAMNNLHRGERAGQVWQAMTDVFAAVMILMSLLGYSLFLALRFRTSTALLITGASLAVMAAVYLMWTA